MSIKKLAKETEAKELRFWGKVLCQEKDYYVAEGIYSQEYADEVPADTEPKGTGANTYTHWVTQDGNKKIKIFFISPRRLV